MDVKEILIEVAKNNPRANFALIQKAYDFTSDAHQGQIRKSGHSYISHPKEVALILAKLKLDSSTIAAGLLHDLVDDTPVSLEKIEKEFGPQIAFLVSGVSKLGRIKYRGVQSQVENLRNMFLAMASDIRVVLIKLADRLHNLQTLNFLPEEKQKRIALETLEIYAPLAYRLGMGRLKGQLEDLAFPYVYPSEYQWLFNSVKDHYQQREIYLKKVQKVLQKQLKKDRVNIIDLHLRAKHYFSLYKKLLRYDNDLNKIYDLVALRVITRSIEDCYAVLGVIHKLWKPLPGRIKDYIAVPKPNGYQSLHTTVFSLDGKIVEIQIRTAQMHQGAEYGIAAHWYYSERKGLKDYLKRIFFKPPEKELVWIKQLQEWQKEIKDSEEFLEGLKIDFFKDRIFVFTPKGDVIDLPEGATAVDFAYAIHTQLGHCCTGAKADNKLIPLDQPLFSGQIIEIITQKQEKPSQDWLRFVKTSAARSRIKNWFKKAFDEQALLKIPLKPKVLEKPIKIHKEIPQLIKKIEVFSSIEINGQTKILTHLAGCCRPEPGQEIKGYITVSRGISIHRIDCHNLNKIRNSQRFISVSWTPVQ